MPHQHERPILRGESFLSPADSIYADFQRVGSIANSGIVESYFSDLVFNFRFTGLVTVSELKHPETVTAVESIMSFWVPSVTVNLGSAWKTEISHAKTVFCTIRYRDCVMMQWIPGKQWSN